MSTAWFQRRAGDRVSTSIDNEWPMLAGELGSSDWVRLPAELGGTELRVQGRHRGPCPMCTLPDRPHVDLERGYGVAECPACKFVFYCRASTSDHTAMGKP